MFPEWPPGSERIKDYPVNHKRIERLCRLMRLQATRAKLNTSKPGKYLKCTLIFSIICSSPGPTRCGLWTLPIFLSREVFCIYVLRLTYTVGLCSVGHWAILWMLNGGLQPCKKPLKVWQPDIGNTDQGSQFTFEEFASYVTRIKTVRVHRILTSQWMSRVVRLTILHWAPLAKPEVRTYLLIPRYWWLGMLSGY